MSDMKPPVVRQYRELSRQYLMYSEKSKLLPTFVLDLPRILCNECGPSVLDGTRLFQILAKLSVSPHAAIVAPPLRAARQSAKSGHTARTREASQNGLGSRAVSALRRRAIAARLRSALAYRRPAGGTDRRARLRHRRPHAGHCRALARPPGQRRRCLVRNARASGLARLAHRLGRGPYRDLAGDAGRPSHLQQRDAAMAGSA